MARNLVHVGIKGTVVGLDRSSGYEVWRTPLKGGQFVNISLDGNVLFAATRGEVFALDATTGQILWNNPMKGLGLGLATFNGNGRGAEAEKLLRDQAAAASAS